MFALLNDVHGHECDEETLWCYSQISSIVKETVSKGKIKLGQHDAQISIKFYLEHLKIFKGSGRIFHEDWRRMHCE